ncbi:MAG: c-type cytochrome [Gammaproteobacteria bacterium]|nr:c-type cytochrome [Gammaproteobacteria bacterium]
MVHSGSCWLGRPRRLDAIAVLCGGIFCLASLPLRADTLYQACFGCHGPNGISQAEHVPSISGLNFQYFYTTMRAFKKGQRNATIMDRIAKGYKTSKLQRMALYFGSQPWTGRTGDVDPVLAARGQALHEEYCEKCHEDNGRFQDRETPPLAGQAKGYLYYQMIDYRDDASGDSRDSMMQTRLQKLSMDDLLALAEYYASELPGAVASRAAE